MQSPIKADNPAYDAQQIGNFKRDFYRDGYLLIPGVLREEEITALKAGLDRVFAEERWQQTDNVYNPYIAVRLFETDPMFQDMLTREPIIGLVENILAGAGLPSHRAKHRAQCTGQFVIQ